MTSERHCIYQHCSGPEPGHALEKIVRSSHWKRPVQFPQRQCRRAEGDQPGVCAAGAPPRSLGWHVGGDRRRVPRRQCQQGHILTKKRLQEQVAALGRSIAEYTAALDANDQAEAAVVPAAARSQPAAERAGTVQFGGVPLRRRGRCLPLSKRRGAAADARAKASGQRQDGDPLRQSSLGMPGLSAAVAVSDRQANGARSSAGRMRR